MARKMVLALLSIDEELLHDEGRTASDGYAETFETAMGWVEESGIYLRDYAQVADSFDINSVRTCNPAPNEEKKY